MENKNHLAQKIQKQFYSYELSYYLSLLITW